MKITFDRVDRNGEVTVQTRRSHIDAVIKHGITHGMRCEEAGFKLCVTCQLLPGEDPTPYFDALYARRRHYVRAGDMVRSETIRLIEVAILDHELPKRAEILVVDYLDDKLLIHYETVDGHGRLERVSTGPLIPRDERQQQLRTIKQKLKSEGYKSLRVSRIKSVHGPVRFVRDIDPEFKKRGVVVPGVLPVRIKPGEIYHGYAERLAAVWWPSLFT